MNKQFIKLMGIVVGVTMLVSCGNKVDGEKNKLEVLEAQVSALQQQNMQLQASYNVLLSKLEEVQKTGNTIQGESIGEGENIYNNLEDLESRVGLLEYEGGELLQEIVGRLEVLEQGEDAWVLYSANSLSYKIIPIGAIPSQPQLSLKEQLQVLANALAVAKFDGRALQVMEIKNVGGKKVAVLNMQDPGTADSWYGEGSWNETHQGSTGGLVNATALIETMLQRQYKGQWIDGVTFTYNGSATISGHVEALDQISYK